MAEAANGSTQPNGKGNGATRKVARKKQSFILWSISLVARLATWAVIFTILFRCPATLEECDEKRPIICKHYFQLKSAVSPYTKPYYDKYASPYVGVAQPYYDTVKTNVISPAHHYAVQYGEPWLLSGRDYAAAQWEVNGQPRIAQLQAVTQAQYQKSIAPHVSNVAALAEPYYAIVRDQSVYAVERIVYPAYQFAKPYAIQGYHASHNFAVMTVLPAAQWSWSNTNAFLDRAVWPRLRVVYVENVEPQLVRIGERLGRYKSHAKSKVLREASSTRVSSISSMTASSSQSSFVSRPSPQSATKPVVDSDPSAEYILAGETESEVEHLRGHVAPRDPEENETDVQRKVREMVAQDLESWQEKFASQAEQGAAEIEDSVDKISRQMIDEKANTKGASLIKQLEETIDTEVNNVKAKINSVVAQHLGGTEVDAQEETVQAVRAAGIAIKTMAQMIRGWREEYDEELKSNIVTTSDVHFAILDETRNLALQQIGMKWAWTDGITYKDWAKYHELKSTLSDWTDELQQLIVTHPTLLEAQGAAAQIEDRGMTAAAAAAKELARLKEVVQLKMQAEDASEEFDTDRLNLAIEEKARAEAEARMKAEEEAKAAQEAAQATEDAPELGSKGNDESLNEGSAGEGDDEDIRIHSVKEASESKPLISEDVRSGAADAAHEDERIHSVKEASESEPLISEDVRTGAADAAYEDERTHSVREASESKPLISEDIDSGATDAEHDDIRIHSVQEASESKPLISEDVRSGATHLEHDEDLHPIDATKVAEDEEQASSEASPEATATGAGEVEAETQHEEEMEELQYRHAKRFATQPVQPPADR